MCRKIKSIQWCTGDWMKDPQLSKCQPATRGIWMDLLCAMYENDQSGTITGTARELARLSRCESPELTAALAELDDSRAADVTENAGIFTVKCRRMSRKYQEKPKHCEMAIAETSTPVMVFPVVGKENGHKEWNLTQAKIDEYTTSFPGVDVLNQCREARQWCIDNPSKQKTAKGMTAFLFKWLSKQQNLSHPSWNTGTRKSNYDINQEKIDESFANWEDSRLGTESIRQLEPRRIC